MSNSEHEQPVENGPGSPRAPQDNGFDPTSFYPDLVVRLTNIPFDQSAPISREDIDAAFREALPGAMIRFVRFRQGENQAIVRFDRDCVDMRPASTSAAAFIEKGKVLAGHEYPDIEVVALSGDEEVEYWREQEEFRQQRRRDRPPRDDRRDDRRGGDRRGFRGDRGDDRRGGFGGRRNGGFGGHGQGRRDYDDRRGSDRGRGYGEHSRY